MILFAPDAIHYSIFIAMFPQFVQASIADSIHQSFFWHLGLGCLEICLLVNDNDVFSVIKLKSLLSTVCFSIGTILLIRVDGINFLFLKHFIVYDHFKFK